MQKNSVGLALLPHVDAQRNLRGEEREVCVCVETQPDLEINSPVGNVVF